MNVFGVWRGKDLPRRILGLELLDVNVADSNLGHYVHRVCYALSARQAA